MKRGRRADAQRTIGRLPGAAAAKRELATILATLDGTLTVEQACSRLGLSPARFFQLREQALAGALAALAPKAAGRPPKPPPETPATEALQQKIAELEEEVQAALVRTEIALTMPHLLRRGKKSGRSAVPALDPSSRAGGGDRDDP